MPTSGAIYVRISKDLADDSLGVQRQEKECRSLADRLGWPVAMVYSDNDMSASNGKIRPAYRDLLAAIESHVVDAVLVWDLDRLTRRPAELEEFFQVCDEAGMANLATIGDHVDPTTGEGVMIARIKGAVAAEEVRKLGRRARAKHAELAERGRWSGGPRPYGYESIGEGRLRVVPAEAEVIVDAARRVLDGETVYGVVTDLNTRGVPTVHGKHWRTPTLRRVLTNPTTAGLREHKGAVVGKAGWEPILDDVTSRRLRLLISDPARATGARPGRVYLLTGGIARCGRCGSWLHAQRRGTGGRVYACVGGPDKGGCGGLSVSADPLEELLSAAVFSRLAGARIPAPARSQGDEDQMKAATELSAVDGRSAELADLFAGGEISRSEWMKARRGIEARRAKAEASLAQSGERRITRRWFGKADALREQWPAMTIDQRRAVISALVHVITVNPAAGRGPRFDSSRVDVEWVV